jgi:signal recognition particle-docking protein FtsY
MAKDKKRGFFSWLGFGQKEKEEEQQQPEQPVEQAEPQAAETPAEPAAAKLDDKLPAQESEPAASVDTPGEWDNGQAGDKSRRTCRRRPNTQRRKRWPKRLSA